MVEKTIGLLVMEDNPWPLSVTSWPNTKKWVLARAGPGPYCKDYYHRPRKPSRSAHFTLWYVEDWEVQNPEDSPRFIYPYLNCTDVADRISGWPIHQCSNLLTSITNTFLLFCTFLQFFSAFEYSLSLFHLFFFLFFLS